MAFNVIKTINLDMTSPNAIVVNAVQYDSSGRIVRANLLNNGTPWSAPSNCFPVIRYRKSDRIGGFYDTDENNVYAIAFSNNRSTIDITMALQMLTTVGNVDVQINFYNSSAQRVTSFKFIVHVQASVIPDTNIVSSEYYNALTSVLQQVVAAGNIGVLEQKAEAAANRAEAAADNAAEEVMERVPAEISSWLSENMTNPSNPAIDTSLSILGAAADAKAAGEKINNLKNGLNEDNGILDLGTLIANTYIQSSNGVAAAWNGNSATDFINTCGADKLITTIAATNGYGENAFYDFRKVFISSFSVQAGTHEITVPPEAVYVRFSNTNANMATLLVAVNPAYRVYNIRRVAKIGAACIFPSSDWNPEFQVSGTTISFFCGRMIGAYYDGDNPSFKSRYVTLMSEPISVPHDYWCIWNIDSNTIQSISDTDLRVIGDVNYCILFYNSSGNVRGPFEVYVTKNIINTKLPSIWKGNCFVAPYGGTDIRFEVVGTTINVICQRYIIYNDDALTWRMLYLGSDSTISVPHDKFLIYINSSNTLSVMSSSEINALSDKYYYVLFYNSNGNVCGPFEMYYNKYRLDNADKGYPSYYDSHIESKINSINSKLIALSSGDAFTFITDIHYPDNKMNSPALIKNICSKTGITDVILNGDYINREALKATAVMQINRVCSKYIYPGINTYRVVGNHEFNNPGASSDPSYLANELSPSELRWPILNPNKKKIVYDIDSLSYYFDNEKEKIRYFVGAVTRGSGTVAESIRWIARQVENIPSGWSVVIFQHTVLSYSGNVVHVVNEHLENIFDAMKAKTSYNYLGTVFDYTGKSFEFVACFCGDYHLDMDYTTAHGAKIIATTCDALLQEGSLARTVGTYNEQAFDVVTVNTALKKVFMTRIGAGNDREFSY